MIGSRRLSLDIANTREGVSRALLVLLALVGVAILYDKPLLLTALAVGFGGVLAMLLDKRLIIPIVVLLMPVEVGSRLIPFLRTEGSAAHDASALSLARMAILSAGAVFVLQAPAHWWNRFVRSSLYLPLALLFVLYLLSMANADDQENAALEVARLTLHVSFFLLIAVYVRDRQALRWTLLALAASGLIVALIGLYQEASGSYLWNEELLRRIGNRRNATFVNSNYYARFLVVSILITTSLLFRERSRMRYPLLASLGLAALALPFTASRAAWMAAAILLPALLLAMPAGARTKINAFKAGAVLSLALAVVVLVAQPGLVDRVQNVGADWEGRFYLVRAGWQMFLDHPFFGIGLDGFPDALRGPYSDFTPGPNSVVRSHTALITLLAELGLAGLLVFVFLLYRLGRLLWRLYASGGPEDRATVAGLTAAFLAIFFSSFFAEALVQDLYLWLIMGLIAALAGIREREESAESAASARAAGLQTGPSPPEVSG